MGGKLKLRPKPIKNPVGRGFPSRNPARPNAPKDQWGDRYRYPKDNRTESIRRAEAIRSQLQQSPKIGGPAPKPGYAPGQMAQMPRDSFSPLGTEQVHNSGMAGGKPMADGLQELPGGSRMGFHQQRKRILPSQQPNPVRPIPVSLDKHPERRTNFQNLRRTLGPESTMPQQDMAQSIQQPAPPAMQQTQQSAQMQPQMPPNQQQGETEEEKRRRLEQLNTGIM